MRPKVRFLQDDLIQRIIFEATEVLGKLGVEINNESALSLLSDHGAKIDKSTKRAKITAEMIEAALKSVPNSFKLYDTFGNEAVDLSGDNVNFTPGSSAIYFLDGVSGERRKPTTADYVEYAKLVERLPNINSQSTAMIPIDVSEKISDSYRLYLNLLYCRKPVVTGAFTVAGFQVMKNLQLALRGSAEELAAKPMTLFTCCPTSPLKWSDESAQNVIDCAQSSIPIEIVPMPLTGFIAPITLVGTLVQHTIETLSGLVISQLANPGTPVVWGGSPAIFDIRYETTPMGAIGTQMIDCAANEIGKYLGLPTQAYIGLSDSKTLDAQAGMETSIGATLASLAGINNISGPGMLEFENMFSLEKLVMDNEICGMLYRMLKGVEPKDDFPAMPHFEELLAEGHLLIADYTQQHLKDEIVFPGPVIDRSTRPRWEKEGSQTLQQRAHDEVTKAVAAYEPISLDETIRAELTNIMESAARQSGMDRLPEIN